MIAEKYADDFIIKIHSEYAKSSLDVATRVTKNVVKLENKYGDITNWDDEALIDIIKTHIGNKVYNYMCLYIKFINQFKEYICEQEGIDFIPFNVSPAQFKKKERLITQKEYETIINQFNLNARDRVIPELAWYGLKKSEIANLKITDIEFVNENTMILHATRPVTITDKQVIDDVKKCMNAHEYYVISNNLKINVHKFIDSPYLIKPAIIGKKPTTKRMFDLSHSFKQQIKAYNIICGDLDIDTVTLTLLRKSKIEIDKKKWRERSTDGEYKMG